jgi:hypothetical protein
LPNEGCKSSETVPLNQDVLQNYEEEKIFAQVTEKQVETAKLGRKLKQLG